VKRLLLATAAVPVLFAGLVATALGQEAAMRTATSATKLTICHQTGSDTNPWRRVTISSRAMTNPRSSSGRTLRAHFRHVGDAIVVGTGACPSVNAAPAPTSAPATRITICHKTGSAANPYRRITVSSRAVTNPQSSSGKTLRGHMSHAGDILLPGTTPCPPGQQNTGVRLTANLQPVQGATGSGSATFRIQTGARRLCYSLTVSGLVNVTAAHIHRVSTQAIVVPLTAPTTGTSSGCITVDRALLREILGTPSAFYANVHTSTFPNGQAQGTLAR
jgi:hypothetical protein